MTTADYSTARIYQALSRVCADATGVKTVLGVNVGDPGNALVVPLADEIPELPAILLVPGPWQIIAGNWRRDTITALGAIFAGRDAAGAGDASVLLMDTFDLLAAAFEARSKAYATEAVLQSALITSGPGLSSTEWPVDSDAWYLTWPFEIEVTVNVAVTYQAQ
jgi:hypothetical protein